MYIRIQPLSPIKLEPCPQHLITSSIPASDQLTGAMQTDRQTSKCVCLSFIILCRCSSVFFTQPLDLIKNRMQLSGKIKGVHVLLLLAQWCGDGALLW